MRGVVVVLDVDDDLLMRSCHDTHNYYLTTQTNRRSNRRSNTATKMRGRRNRIPSSSLMGICMEFLFLTNWCSVGIWIRTIRFSINNIGPSHQTTGTAWSSRQLRSYSANLYPTVPHKEMATPMTQWNLRTVSHTTRSWAMIPMLGKEDIERETSNAKFLEIEIVCVIYVS